LIIDRLPRRAPPPPPRPGEADIVGIVIVPARPSFIVAPNQNFKARCRTKMESAMSTSRRREWVALLTDRAYVGAALARESMDKEEEREPNAALTLWLAFLAREQPR
jgi:hypothetical protein